MVKFGKKEKEMCNGKLIVTDFRKLSPDDFFLYEFESKKDFTEQMLLIAHDGKIYINKKEKGIDLIVRIFESLMKQNRRTLREYKKELANRYPKMKTFGEWSGMASRPDRDNNEVIQCLVKLLIPIEVKRREIERNYYSG